MNPVRVLIHSGVIGYRALFNFRHPSVYVPTMLGSPLFQILFFAYLGRHSGLADDEFFVTGNAILVSAMAGVFGMVLLIANERQFGTLSPLLATPANRLAVFLGRMLPMIVHGGLVSSFGFVVGFALLGFRPPAGSLPGLAVVVAVAAASGAGFGLALGALAMRAGDLWVGSNLTYYLLFLLCGANLPLSALPGWLAAIGRGLPFTHGIEAARQLVAGAALPEVAGLIGREAFTGAGYAILGYLLLRLFEVEGRHRASLGTA